MKLIKFELVKMKKSNFLIILLMMFTTIIVSFSFYIFYTKSDFISEQKQYASSMIHKINEEGHNEEAIIEERDLYAKILIQDTWQETYGTLNEIDQLFLDYPNIVPKIKSDLPFDYETNIDYRNYCIANEISPDDFSSGIMIYKLFSECLDYLLPILIFVISAYIFTIEYEEKAENYYYTLPYKQRNIMIGKIIATLIACILVLGIPLLVLYFISSLVFGFSNPNILIASSKQFGTLSINGFYFMAIGTYLQYVLVIMIMNILYIASMVSLLVRLVKTKYSLLYVGGVIIILINIYFKLLMSISKVLTSPIALFTQVLIGSGFLMILILINTIKKHKEFI